MVAVTVGRAPSGSPSRQPVQDVWVLIDVLAVVEVEELVAAAFARKRRRSPAAGNRKRRRLPSGGGVRQARLGSLVRACCSDHLSSAWDWIRIEPLAGLETVLIDVQRPLVLGDGLVGLSAAEQGVAEIGVGGGESRIDSQRRSILVNGLVELTAARQCLTEVVVDDLGVGLDAHGLVILFDGLVKPAQAGQGLAEIIVGIRGVGVDLQRLADTRRWPRRAGRRSARAAPRLLWAAAFSRGAGQRPPPERLAVGPVRGLPPAHSDQGRQDHGRRHAARPAAVGPEAAASRPHPRRRPRRARSASDTYSGRPSLAGPPAPGRSPGPASPGTTASRPAGRDASAGRPRRRQ